MNDRLTEPHKRLDMSKNYFAYLLRLWLEEDSDQWRILLEEVPGGQQRAFIDLEGLLAYLQTMTPRDNRAD